MPSPPSLNQPSTVLRPTMKRLESSSFAPRSVYPLLTISFTRRWISLRRRSTDHPAAVFAFCASAMRASYDIGLHPQSPPSMKPGRPRLGDRFEKRLLAPGHPTGRDEQQVARWIRGVRNDQREHVRLLTRLVCFHSVTP